MVKRILENKRRALSSKAEGNFTFEMIDEILKEQNYQCIYCFCDLRKVKNHIDHILPLSRGGSNLRNNIQILCASCNIKKQARTHSEYLQVLSTKKNIILASA